MSTVQPGICGNPGPGDSHCTDIPGHGWSCYDAGEDVSFNHRQDFVHACDDPNCKRQHFVNEGDA